MSKTNRDGFLQAVRVSAYGAHATAETWKYAFPIACNTPVEELHVRISSGAALELRDTNWAGVFECARSRHVDVLAWPTANAIVVAAANAVYIVDPRTPEHFSGLAAEINGVAFDESAQHMFVAETLRIHAFSFFSRQLLWVSEPLDGYDARLRACGRRVLTLELKSPEPAPDGDDAYVSLVRLRIEDGAVLKSRFRRLQDYRRRKLRC